MSGIGWQIGEVVMVDQSAHEAIARRFFVSIDDYCWMSMECDVIDLGGGQHRFTDENGRTRVTWPANGVLTLRVREVGYPPRQRTLRQSDASGATATFEMTRVAYVISPVKATSHCSSSAAADSGALDLSVSALDQLKQGAEKYDQFRRHYPFEATVERR